MDIKQDLVDGNGKVYGWRLVSDRSGVVKVNRTLITTEEFKNLLTEDEFFDMAHSTHPVLERGMWVLTNRDSEVDVKSNTFKLLLNTAKAEGIIDNDRRTELLLGIEDV